MRKAYYHFSQIYNSSNETLLCVNKQLNVVYISNAFRLNYDFDVEDGILTGCFIPTEYFVKIKNAINEQRSYSFDYICAQHGSAKKCFVLPTKIGTDNYATLLIIDNNQSIFEQTQSNEIRTHIIQTEQNINSYANEVLTLARRKSKKLYQELQDNKIIINTLKIRSEFEKLATLSKKSITHQEYYLIDVNKYIKRTESLLNEIFGENKINFTLDLYPQMLVTELCYDVFDLLLAYSITCCIKNLKNSADLYIKTKPLGKENVVIIADSIHSCETVEEMIHSNDIDPNCIEQHLIQKVVNSYNGKFTTYKSVSGRTSIGFTLPPKPDRLEYLREEENDVTAHNVLNSSFCAILSDILDD